MYDPTPTVFVPTPGADNGPALRALLASGVRWIQIKGPMLKIDTTVSLEDDGEPANYVFIQPHPSFSEIMVDASGVGRDPVDPTNPSYAGFGYEGLRTPASYLTANVTAGSTTLVVDDGSLYTVGDWVNVSNASTDPGTSLLPKDGPGAKYRIDTIDGDELTIDRPAERAHPDQATVSKCKPIFGTIVEGLRFVGNVTVGVHVHDDIGGVYRDIKSAEGWEGRVLMLLDNWNIGSLIEDCFAVGTTPGTGSAESAWGVGIEGGSATRYSNCGGTKCGTGITVNYGYNVRGIGTLCYGNNVNLALLTACINCFDIQPRTAYALISDIETSVDNVDSGVIDRREATIGEMGMQSPETIDWRSPPSASIYSESDKILVADKYGNISRINPYIAQLSLTSSGALQRENIWIESIVDYGGNIQVSNTLQHWGIGMLSVANWRDFVVYNNTTGQVDFRVAYDSGNISVRGDFNIGAGKELKINNVTMLRGRGAAISDATGGTTVDTEARAAINALLAQLRAGTLPSA